MARNNKFWIEKNILDAEYQKYLNYFNISTLSLITSLFSILIGYFSNTISLDIAYELSISLSLIFGIIIYHSKNKTNVILNRIKNL